MIVAVFVTLYLFFNNETADVRMSKAEISELEEKGESAFVQRFSENTIKVNHIWYDKRVNKIVKDDYLQMGGGKDSGIQNDNIVVFCCDFYEIKNMYDGTRLDVPQRRLWTLLFVRTDANSPWTLKDYGYPVKSAYSIIEKESKNWDEQHLSPIQ